MSELNSKENLWEKLKKDPWYIENIENPEEDMCLYCVENSWNILRVIKNPSEKVIKKAIEAKGWAIQYVKDQNKELQMAAVESDFDAIQYIRNPFRETSIRAVGINWKAIKYIDKPDIEIKRIAVKQNAEAIMYIEVLEEEKYLFVKDNVNSIKYMNIDNLDKLEAVLIEKVSDDEVKQSYIIDLLKLNALELNKIKLIHKYGSKKAKAYLIDFKLSV